jgi:hypothetical protein
VEVVSSHEILLMSSEASLFIKANEMLSLNVRGYKF